MDLREKVVALDREMNIVRSILVPEIEAYYEHGSWTGVENFFLRNRENRTALIIQLEECTYDIWFDERGFEDALLYMEQTYLKVRNSLITSECQ